MNRRELFTFSLLPLGLAAGWLSKLRVKAELAPVAPWMTPQDLRMAEMQGFDYFAYMKQMMEQQKSWKVLSHGPYNGGWNIFRSEPIRPNIAPSNLSNPQEQREAGLSQRAAPEQLSFQFDHPVSSMVAGGMAS